MPTRFNTLATAAAYCVFANLYFRAGPFREVEAAWSYDGAVVVFGLLHVAVGTLWPRPILLAFPLMVPWAVGYSADEGFGELALVFLPAGLIGISVGLLLRFVPRWWTSLDT